MHAKRAGLVVPALMAMFALASAVGSVAAQQGTIGGTVVDAQTLQPLDGAQVSVLAAGIGAITDEQGRFRITDVPGDEVMLQVRLIGYAQRTLEDVSVGATDVRIELQQTALELERLVITGTAGATQKRALGNSVTQIDASEVESAPVNSVSDVLAGRVSGMVVQQGTGVVGSASEITVRGRASMSLGNGPIIYIDGVRVNNRMQGEFADPVVSRLDDLSPSDIESVEVIKGPAAATLYGTEASNGVIQIITRRGLAGRSELSLRARLGANWMRNASEKLMMPNYWWDDATGDITVVDLIERETDAGRPIFRTGMSQNYSLGLSGGSGGLAYHLSGSAQMDDGISPDNTLDRFTGRVNLTVDPADELQIRTSTGLVVNQVDLLRQGVRGEIPAIMWGQPTEESLNGAQRGFHIAPPEVLRRAFNTSQDANRFTTSVTVDHEATDWLTHRLTFGVDFTDQEFVHYTPRLSDFDAQFFAQSFAEGQKEVEREEVMFTTLDYAATGEVALTDALVSTTSGGLQVYAKKLEFMSAEGLNFPAAGIKTIAGAGTQFGRDDFLENNTVGVYLQQQMAWKDRLFVTGAIRADDNSAFGENFDLVYYPKVSLSWVLSEEPFWDVGWVSSLRLRGAYGESGQQPDVFAALRTFAPRATPEGVAAVTPQAVGNPDLGPERGKEIEAGFDAAFLDGRLTLDLTYYDQRTSDAILTRNIAPSTGFAGSQFVNIGEVSNRGVEAQIEGQLIQADRIDWDLGLGLSTNRNRVTELGIDGYLANGWTGRHAEGYPVGSQWTHEVVSAEYDPGQRRAVNAMCADGQGGTMPCEESPRVYMGHPHPNVEGSVNTGVTLFDRLRFSGLVDFKLGHVKYVTELWNRCVWRQVCEINAYPEHHSPEALYGMQNGGADEWDYIMSDASFTRLREVSVDYRLPEALTTRFGFRTARVSLAARNLGVWSDYPGIDPETVNIPYSSSVPEAQAMLPPLQQVMASVHVTF